MVILNWNCVYLKRVRPLSTEMILDALRATFLWACIIKIWANNKMVFYKVGVEPGVKAGVFHHSPQRGSCTSEMVSPWLYRYLWVLKWVQLRESGSKKIAANLILCFSVWSEERKHTLPHQTTQINTHAESRFSRGYMGCCMQVLSL